MRRRLRKFLPIVLMALAVQILAPIAACWAAGIVASDPLAGATICHDASDQVDQPGQTGRHAHDSTCALCCLAHAGTSLDTPKATVAARYRHALRVVWHDVVPELRDSGTSGQAQARAPPTIS